MDANEHEWVPGSASQGAADPIAYRDREDLIESRDPYQNLYNLIANDVVAARDKLKPDEIQRIRQISNLRFAASIAPARRAFSCSTWVSAMVRRGTR